MNNSPTLPPCRLCGGQITRSLAGRVKCADTRSGQCDASKNFIESKNWFLLHGPEPRKCYRCDKLLDEHSSISVCQECQVEMCPQPLPRPDAPGWWVEEKRPTDFCNIVPGPHGLHYQPPSCLLQPLREGRWLRVVMPGFPLDNKP